VEVAEDATAIILCTSGTTGMGERVCVCVCVCAYVRVCVCVFIGLPKGVVLECKSFLNYETPVMRGRVFANSPVHISGVMGQWSTFAHAGVGEEMC